jgi:hypothetical protein
MPSLVRTSSLALALVLAPLPAAAGTLVAASLTMQFTNLNPIMFVGSGVTGSSSGAMNITVAAGTGFADTIHFPSPTSAAPPISGWDYTVGANGAGSFSGATPALVGGPMSIAFHICGEAYGGLCLINLNLPLGVNQTVTPPVVSGIGITMHGSEWTAGTAAIALTQGGTATEMGANGLNGKGAGTLVLVSSVNVLTSIAGQLPSFATLTLDFVPEPASLPLLGAVTLALALGVRQLRERRA